MLHGTTLSQVVNIDGVIYRSARQLLLDLDPQETKKIVQLTSIYDRVFDYSLPVDLKGNKVVDIRPQVNRTLRDRYTQTYNQEFDIYKDYTLTPNFTINFNNALKTVRIDAPLINTGIVMNQSDSITGNGTWTASGTASNLTIDNVNYVGGSGTLTFNIATGTGILTNSNMAAVDLTAHLNQSSIFFYVYLPTASKYTSVQIKWGNDSSNYWTKTLTSTHEGTVFVNGWNLLRADWASSTTVGAPNASRVDFIEVSYIYTGTSEPNVKLDNIVSRLGVLMEIEYYSKFLFRDSVTGAFQESVTDDSNLINLDTETYNLLVYQVALQAVQQALGQDAGYDTNLFAKLYQDSLLRYKMMYKSEVSKPRSTYYRKPSTSFRRFFGRGYNY